MNLRNISGNQIIIWAVLAVGLVVALVIGSAVGSSDTRFLAGALAVIPLAVIFIKLKTNIWVLMPMSWYLTGRLTWLPLPFTVRDLCFLAVIFTFTLFFATRVVKWKRSLSSLDYIIYINLAYLGTVYLRNPVGVYAIGSDIVGGKPYFEIALAFFAFGILSRVKLTDKVAKLFPLFYIIPSSITAALDLLTRITPQLAAPLYMLYSGVGLTAASANVGNTEDSGMVRLVGLREAAYNGVLALCARYRPITLLSPMYPLRAALFFAGFVGILLTGFRAALLATVVTFLLAILLRRQRQDIWLAGAVGLLSLLIVVGLQGSVLQLPLTVQRTLSWLPGDWDREALTNAEGSSRWRFEMVEWAWNDTLILRNKIWGQGIGFSMDDMNLIANASAAGGTGDEFLGGSDRESFMIMGSFHNGPTSAIRSVGVVGLTLYAVLLFFLVIRAWKLCVLTQGSEAFPIALFVGIPVIYLPFSFLVLTGFYEIDIQNSIFAAGLINLITNYYNGLPAQSTQIRYEK
jgi:hypothetical protein